MKKIQTILLAGALIIGAEARATLYDFTFTGFDGLTTATGWLDVNNNGIATSGALDVTYNGATSDFGALWPAGPVIENNNGDETWGSDNVFNPNSTTQGGFLSLNGLIFYNGTPGKVGGWVWLGDDSPGDLTPQLVASGKAPASFGYFTPFTDGQLSVWLVPISEPATLAPVPEPNTWVAAMLILLPLGISTLRILRKRRAG